MTEISKDILNVGSRLDLRIDRLALGGDGVARLDSRVVFVPYACPGDTVHVEITESRQRYARARLLRVIAASPQRVQPPCNYHFKAPHPHPLPRGEGLRVRGLFCGGCSWQHIDYPAQLDAKRRLVQETLERIGGQRGIDVRPALGMRDPWRYRNKVQQPMGIIGGRLVSGFYAPDSHDIVPIEDCLVQSELSVKILNRARSLLERYRMIPKHLWLRASTDHKALLVFVTRGREFPHERPILEALAREFPQLVGIHQNVNPGKTNVILGRMWRKLCGADFLEERLGKLRFLISPGAFFQVNTLQTEALYDIVKRMAGRGDRLLDLYGGVGGIALWLADSFKQVIGVDEAVGAIADAKRNAGLNGIRNATFIAESAEQFLARFKGDEKLFSRHPRESGPSTRLAPATRLARPRLNSGGGPSARFVEGGGATQQAPDCSVSGPNPPAPPFCKGGSKGGFCFRGNDGRRISKDLMIVLDPPRAGCSPPVLKGVLRLRPGRLIYVSCDPATLARDIAFLARGGYRVREVQPVDLFPHTPHIETVVSLTAH